MCRSCSRPSSIPDITAPQISLLFLSQAMPNVSFYYQVTLQEQNQTPRFKFSVVLVFSITSGQPPGSSSF